MPSVTKAERYLRKTKIAVMVRQGLGTAQIKATCEKQLHWKMPARTLGRYLHEIARDMRDAYEADLKDQVALQLARYTDLFQAASAKQNLDQQLRVLQRIDRLLGLQAPQKRIIQGGPDGSPPVRLEVVQALRLMSQEERDEYRRMMGRIEELGTNESAVRQIGPAAEEDVIDV
jgi:hypothetical protein